jgi:hypothetical protein
MSRPKRLWVVVLVNVMAGVLTLAALGFLLAKSLPFAGALMLSFAPTVLICGVLIVSSIFAFRGHARSRWVALGTAILFFGLYLIQSLWLYYHPTLPPEEMPSLASSVERNSLAIVLNLWAFLSDKTDAFFDEVPDNDRSKGP